MPFEFTVTDVIPASPQLIFDTWLDSEGHTVMTDVVRYRSPAGPLGRLVDRMGLTTYMARLLAQRNAWLKQELEGG